MSLPPLNDIVPAQAPLLPDFLLSLPADDNTAQAAKKAKPSRLSIVQGATKAGTTAALGEPNTGTVYLSPNNLVVAHRADRKDDRSEAFVITPIYHFVEWCAVPDYSKKKGDEPFTLARSFDPRSELARRANSFDPAKINYQVPWTDRDGKERMVEVKAQEFNNFVVVLQESPYGGRPTLMSFGKGAVAAGRNFCGLIGMAPPGLHRPVPMFTRRFLVQTVQMPNPKGAPYWAWTVGVDAKQPYITNPEEVEMMRQFKIAADEAFKSGELETAETDDIETPRAANSGNMVDEVPDTSNMAM